LRTYGQRLYQDRFDQVNGLIETLTTGAIDQVKLKAGWPSSTTAIVFTLG
jgi:hypothetical protein